MLQTLRKMALLNFQTFLACFQVLKTVGSKRAQIGHIVTGFQLLNDEEIIAEVRHSPKEDDDEGENDSQVKISNNDAFECFSKGLAWLQQQEQYDSSEQMLLRKLRDRAARQRMTNLMKLPFKSL
ncbi:hypothetical protein AVEN_208173-1 [Araneus ventricosus]|uniref:Uncharacterized protein n=1 Tax=Araneus ventricosus TaxID=182803 RepID=A0A4Y2JUB0_ARAVE|nr:hypothetical protein AVEN_208173-1 [Araneus ventricosus]